MRTRTETRRGGQPWVRQAASSLQVDGRSAVRWGKGHTPIQTWKREIQSTKFVLANLILEHRKSSSLMFGYIYIY